ncbi:MAG: threonine transporter RhtB [Gammaproteobacteria bacterium]|nr:MAG: threonine transporter RhtB [Gammaproteobacteria bacterium]
MIDNNLLLLFIPTFLFVSATPGMCMTLAMTLGMTIGIRRTLWMMWGELLGVATVAILAVIGVAKIMLEYPSLFLILKYLGGAYLCYLGIKLWRSHDVFKAKFDSSQQGINKKTLFAQGFISAIANPKGWAFMIALLPPFINPQMALTLQLSILVGIILISEFSFMMIYATGGKTLRRLLQQSDKLAWLNRISGSLMIMVGIWLAFG